MTFFMVGMYPPIGRGKFIFWRGRGMGIGERNVGLTYRMKVALRCGCSISVAE